MKISILFLLYKAKINSKGQCPIRCRITFLKKEKEYILEYNSKERGYNQDSGGGFEKLVYQYDLEGELQNIFINLQEAADAVEVNKKSISAACLGRIKTCKGFYWSYDYLDVFEPNVDKRIRKVQQFDSDKQLIKTYLSIADASNNTEINRSCNAKCCRNERKSAGRFLWKFY